MKLSSGSFLILFIVMQVGSVDEESTKSDEEYDDLAMQDVLEGYWSDDDEELKSKVSAVSGDQGTKMQGNKDHQNLDLFLRTSKNEPVTEPLCSYSSLLSEKSEKRLPPSGKAKLRKRSLSIPALRKDSAIKDPIHSGAPQR